MLLTRISFIPQFDHEEPELTWIAETLLMELQRNGQICGDYVIGWHDGILEAYVYAAHRNALDESSCSPDVRKAERWVVQQFGIEPECEIIDDDRSLRVPSLKSAQTLFLFCSGLENGSPVRHGSKGTPLSLTLLPLPAGLVQDLTVWQNHYQQMDRLWLHSDCLQTSLFEQLSRFDSDLMTEGRQLAGQVEEATKLPVLTYLLNYEHIFQVDQSECPSCGQPWFKKRKHFPSLEPFHRFHFQCDDCRLCSHHC